MTASALLDVLTREEIDRLAAACAGAGVPALLTLSVVGRVEFTPADPLDAEFAEAFNAHQRRGELLGPDAITAACEALTGTARRYAYQLRPAPTGPTSRRSGCAAGSARPSRSGPRWPPVQSRICSPACSLPVPRVSCAYGSTTATSWRCRGRPAVRRERRAGTAEAVGVDAGTSCRRGAATAVRVHADADLVPVRGDVSPADTAPTGGEVGEPRSEGEPTWRRPSRKPTRPRPPHGGLPAHAHRFRRRRPHPRCAALAARYRCLPGRPATGRRADPAGRAGARPADHRVQRLALVPVARGLRIRLSLGGAVADYYRALFLNAALPGGVLGHVHRAVRHGQSTGTSAAAYAPWSSNGTAGQAVLVAVGAVVLLTFPSPVLADARRSP